MATETSTAGYSRVIENLVVTSTLRLDGPEWDNTLIRNVTIQNVSGDGIFLRNVDNVRIENCTITNVSGVGIKLSSEGSTSNVTIEGNTISQIGKDGISAAQRESTGVDHPGLKIIDNKIDHAGTSGTGGLLHGIYVQSTDFLIEGNLVTNSVDGNGISVRSSGIVRDNMVDGTGKSGIGYYADHMRGPSNLLVIENNVVTNSGLRESSRNDIDLLNIPNTSYAVGNFIIRDNIVTDNDGTAVGIHKDYATLGAKTTVSGTKIVSESQVQSLIANWNVEPAPTNPTPDPTSPTGGLQGTAGADNLTGGAGADTLNGLGGNDMLKGGAGADTFVIVKGNGSDTILDFLPQYSDVIKLDGYGYATFDQLKAKASQVGADTVIQLSSTETLTLKNVQVGALGASEFTFTNVVTPTPDPVPTPPVGGKEVTGTAGADVLQGGAGNDVLTGGAGGDTFVITKGMGSDTITDFYTQYSDVIKLDGYAFASFDQVKAKAVQQGADTLIHLSTTETLTLKNVQVGDLGASEFTFSNVAAPAPAPAPSTPVAGKEVTGTAGADVLQGGAGNDVLKGGAGGDTFVITKGMGSDTIVDFYPQYSDVIKLDGYGLASFDQVKAKAGQVGADTVIQLSSTETLTLKGVQKGDLGASEFTFGSGTAAQSETTTAGTLATHDVDQAHLVYTDLWS